MKCPPSAGVFGAILGLCLGLGIPASPGEAATEGDWPAWRGDGSGTSNEKGLPLCWDARTNIAWKTPLPGEGISSPIVWGDRVFLTASSEGGRKRHVLCLAARDGHTIWNVTITPTRETKTYRKTGFAAPTPATDGKRVYAFFDSPGLVAVRINGEVAWTRDLGPFKNMYNMASSPVLCGDQVVLCCDHAGPDSFIAAFDSASGKPRWRTRRALGLQYATPLVISVEGKQQIVANGKVVCAYDAATGRCLWSCKGLTRTVAPSVVFDGELVYASSGRNGPSMAIDPRGSGDVSETHVRMYYPAGGPYVPSPILCPWLLVPGDNGAIRCLNPEGRVIAQARVPGHFTASPVAGDGKLYWTCEKGNTYVLDAAALGGSRPRIEVIRVNPLGETVLASPAIAHGRLYIRTDKHLFCIAGHETTKAVARTRSLPASFAELRRIYDANRGAEQELEKVAMRLEVIEAMGRLEDVRVVPFFVQVAKKDHSDVGEEATKQLGRFGEEAVPALAEILCWRRAGDFLKVAAAGHLARLKSTAAVPALVEASARGGPLVRISALRALAQIAQAHGSDRSRCIDVLVAGLADKEGVVKVAAIEGLGLLATKLARRRDTIVRALRERTADKNPMVANRARDVLRQALQADVPSGS